MAATMTPSKRARTHAIAISKETAFNTDPASGYLQIAAWGFDPSPLQPATIENQQVQTDLRGVNPAGEGLLHDATVSLNTYAEGLGLSNASGDGDTPALTAFSHLLVGWCGQDAAQVTGDTVKALSTPTTTTVEVTTVANFAVGDAVAFILAGKFYVRYITAIATDELTLNCALPSAPSAGDVVYGSLMHDWQETLSQSLAIKAIGKGDAQNVKMLGCVSGLELPEAAAGEPQTVSWTINQASFNKADFTEAQSAPTAFRPSVVAGGEFKIRKTGETAWTSLTYLRANLTLNQEVSADEDVESEYGIEAWTRLAQKMQLSLHFKNDAGVPTGVTAPDWRALFYDGNEVDNTFEIMLNYSRGGRGRTFSLRCLDWRVNMAVETQVDVDGKSLQKVTFMPKEDSSDPAVTTALL